ncbi:NUDIX hydrolase [Leptospira sp. GIMC2001]|uniref:NUDIX hydrolase n=1 Tax=Leptospira sp. GIMC2001 TaxID=1513297 RepID=UPI00234A9740|nr:NUDIX hydrolase [Leptospira sp. GIMC2001]WCL49424.1 NUDIX hydrolase [Leptospira sp. GIMC2001]
MSDHGFFQITQKLFLRRGDELLVLRDKKSGYGDLPGGRMTEKEFFEDWIDSLDREMAEEMGSGFLYSTNPEPIFIHKHKVTEGNHPCIIIGYEGKYISGEVEMSDEHDYMEWVNVKTYDPSTLFEDYMLDAVRKYLKEYA